VIFLRLGSYIELTSFDANALNDPPPPAHIEEIFHLAISRLQILHDSARRSAISLLFVAFTFELFRRSAVRDVQFGPIQLNDLSVINKALPALGSYLMYEIWSTSVRYWHTRELLMGINDLYRPKLVAFGFGDDIFPPAPALFGPLPRWLRSPRADGVAARVGTLIFRILSAVTPFGFVVYWYVITVSNFGIRDFVTDLSLAIGIFFTLYTTLLAIAGASKGILASALRL
jgi:hypothetical protein